MVKLLCIVAVSSLMIAPPVFSRDEGEGPPPAARFQLDVDGRLSELLAGRDRPLIMVVPDVPGARGSRTCLAQPGRQSTTAPDACDFGRQLSRMEPCTRPEDCRALDLWSAGVGPPSLQQARPSGEVLRPEVELKRQTTDPAKIDAADAEDEDEN